MKPVNRPPVGGLVTADGGSMIPAIPLPAKPSSQSRRARQGWARAVQSTELANGALHALNRLAVSYAKQVPVLSQSFPTPSPLTHSKPSPRPGVSSQPSPHNHVVRQPQSQGGAPAVAGALPLQHRAAHQHAVVSATRFVRRSASAVRGGEPAPALGGRAANARAAGSSSYDYTHTAGSQVSGPPPTAVPIHDADAVALPKAAGTADMLALLPPAMARQYASESAILASGVVLPAGRPERARFGGPPEQYERLIRRMHACGMLEFTTAPRAVNSLFAVPKPDGSLRLIVNAKPANRAFTEPPHVDLPGPDRIAALRPLPGQRLFVAKSDVDGCFHRIRTPPFLRPFFALPPVDVAVVRDLLPVGLRAARRVYPMCSTLPMGWSHSVVVAQAMHEHVCERVAGLSAADRLTAASDARVDRTRHAIYIDDVLFFGHDRDDVARAQERYCAAVASVGLPTAPAKTVAPSCGGVTCIGVLVDGTEMTVGVAPDKLSELIDDTRAVLRAGRCTGRAMAQLVGSWTWACLPVRATLCIFDAVYRFARVAQDREYALWSGVREELRTAAALAPLMYARLGPDQADWTIASDASTFGLGVVAAPTPPGGMCAQPRAVASLQRDAPHTPVVACRGCAHGPGHARPQDLPWKVAISAQWRRDGDHINALELRAVHAAVRWASRRPGWAGRRLDILVDSSVAAGALRKGRSSSRDLLVRIRQINSAVLAAGVQLNPLWCESSVNPSDGASRGQLNVEL